MPVRLGRGRRRNPDETRRRSRLRPVSRPRLHQLRRTGIPTLALPASGGTGTEHRGPRTHRAYAAFLDRPGDQAGAAALTTGVVAPRLRHYRSDVEHYRSDVQAACAQRCAERRPGHEQERSAGQRRWVRPAGIEPATKCLEGGRGGLGCQLACRLTKAIGTWVVRAETLATGPVVVAVVVGGGLGLRACPHSCRAFRRWTAVKAARAVNRRPGLGVGLDGRPAAVRTIGRWEGLPGGEWRYVREARCRRARGTSSRSSSRHRAVSPAMAHSCVARAALSPPTRNAPRISIVLYRYRMPIGLTICWFP